VRPHATHSLAGWRVDIDAVEQRLEGRIVDFDMARRRARRLRDLERAAVEPLVEDAHPGAVEEEELERIPTASEKHEERAASCVVTDLLFGEPRQPIERKPKIDRLERDVHLDARGDHRGDSRARTTSRSTLGSNPRRTAIRTWPTTTAIIASSSAGNGSPGRTTRAIAMDAGDGDDDREDPRGGAGAAAPVRFSSCAAHHRSDESEIFRSLPNARAVMPLARQARTRSDHRASLSVMPARMRRSCSQRKNGAGAGDTNKSWPQSSQCARANPCAKILLDIFGKTAFVMLVRVGEKAREVLAHDPVERRVLGTTGDISGCEAGQGAG
jgi:hypothetical protein